MRVRSLKIDKNDDSAFRHPYGGNMNLESEFRQHIPFFFTREGSEVDLVGTYKGRSAFMICNGPSFVKLDHEKLKLPGVVTFGINNGPKTFRPDFWTCVDDPVRFLKSIWLDPKIKKFIPQSHFEKPIFDNEKWENMEMKVGECPNVVGYRRNEKFNAQRFLAENTLNWGNHKQWGGGRSVMLPSLRILHLLGFRKVYLLGCDMKMSQSYTYHFDEQRSKGAVNCNMSTYDRLKSDYLPSLKPIFDQEGFQVFNCNSESELKVFPFISFDEAITEATKDLGDIKNERVWGMYSAPEEKNNWKQEPDKEQKNHIKTLKALSEGANVSDVFVANPPKAPKATPQDPQKTPEIIPSNNTTIKNVANDENITSSRGENKSNGEIVVVHSDNYQQKSKIIYNDVKESLKATDNPVKWNPFNKVVVDHRNGSIDINATNIERAKRNLIVPWTPEIGEKEVRESPIQ